MNLFLFFVISSFNANSLNAAKKNLIWMLAQTNWFSLDLKTGFVIGSVTHHQESDPCQDRERPRKNLLYGLHLAVTTSTSHPKVSHSLSIPYFIFYECIFLYLCKPMFCRFSKRRPSSSGPVAERVNRQPFSLFIEKKNCCTQFSLTLERFSLRSDVAESYYTVCELVAQAEGLILFDGCGVIY